MNRSFDASGLVALDVQLQRLALRTRQQLAPELRHALAAVAQPDVQDLVLPTCSLHVGGAPMDTAPRIAGLRGEPAGRRDDADDAVFTVGQDLEEPTDSFLLRRRERFEAGLAGS